MRRLGLVLIVMLAAPVACGGVGAPGTTLRVDEYRAERPGRLPEPGERTVAGVDLPPGHTVPPVEGIGSGQVASEPVLWLSDAVLADVGARWSALRRRFPQTGLWPVVVETYGEAADGAVEIGELDPVLSSSPDRVDVRATLEGWWHASVPDKGQPADHLRPFTRDFPGMAKATTAARVDEGAPDRVARNMQGRLGLVAVTRPADAVARIGWSGPVNYFNDMGPLAAVLRSWEDRFGAVTVGIGFDTLTVAVRRPPASLRDATLVAAEHLAVCPDVIFQDAPTVGGYARNIRAKPMWGFWWD